MWTGEHIEAVLEELISLPDLLDLSVRFAAEKAELLVSPRVLLGKRDESLFADMLQACASQVNAEISSMVGKKYIPKLYIEREIEQQFDEVIHPEKQVLALLSELKRIDPGNPLIEFKPENSEIQKECYAIEKYMKVARSMKAEKFSRDSILSRFCIILPENLKGRMHVITASAGTGKTNLFCHLAKYYVKQHPTIFITGRSGITEKTSIKELIELKLGRFYTNRFTGERLFDRFISTIKKKGMKLLIFLDAVNEHRDLDLLNMCIVEFLLEIRDKPVIVIVSCRDVYRSFFDTSTWPILQWKEIDFILDVYSSAEFAKAINAYFDFYNINASLSKEAKNKLSHPLILRFFCEAYGDPSSVVRKELHNIPDIRLKVLFDDYLERKLESIRHTAPRRRRTVREIENFLFSLVNEMRRLKTRELNRDNISAVTKVADMESPESVYVAILGEEIILEEEPDKETNTINVIFTYDEFMEYMIARAMVRSCSTLDEENIVKMIKECQSGVEDFPSFVGVVEYLGIILREDCNIAIGSSLT